MTRYALLSRNELANSIIDNTDKCSPHVTGCRKSTQYIKPVNISEIRVEQFVHNSNAELKHVMTKL